MPFPFARYRGIIMRKTVQVWHCPLQNKNSRLALLPCFYGNTAGCKTDRRQWGQTGATFSGKGQKKKCLNLKVAQCYVIPAAQSSLLPREKGSQKKKKKTLLKAWFEPLLLSVQTRAGPLCPYMEGWMTSPASGALLFSTTSTFFIVHWWHVWNVMANSPRSRAPPALPLRPCGRLSSSSSTWAPAQLYKHTQIWINLPCIPTCW